MNLRGLISVSGKPGLYKLLGQNKSGFILESLDEQKTKLVANMTTTKMASLEDITVFGETEDLKLIDILENIKQQKEVPDPKKADGNQLRTFFRDAAPGHDENRVYTSDLKKIITWFNILKELPLFNEAAPDTPGEHSLDKPAAHHTEPDKAAVALAKAPKKTQAPPKAATRVSQKSK